MQRIPYTRQASRLFTLLALILVGILGLSGVASASTDAPPARPLKNVIISASASEMSTASVRPWTAEEMRAAKPLPLPVVKGSNSSAIVPKPTGPAGSIPWQAPQGAPANPSVEDGVSIQANATQVPDSAYGGLPYSPIGKLFLTVNGVRRYCSAAIVKGHGVWTAGHCVHAGNNSYTGWYLPSTTNMVFVPQYNNGVAPLGQCPVTNLWTHMDWYTNGEQNGGLDHDYGGVTISCDASASTGRLGFLWNQNRQQLYSAVGYPDNFFGGEKMMECRNSPLYTPTPADPGPSGPTGFSPARIAITCDFSPGASGGPWRVWSYYMNGNNSWIDGGGHTYSPYFDGDAKLLWDALPE